jgi:hypothetical protein
MSATPKTTGAASGSDANSAGETMSTADVKFVLGFLSSFAKKPEMNWDAMAINMGISKKSMFNQPFTAMPFQSPNPILTNPNQAPSSAGASSASSTKSR